MEQNVSVFTRRWSFYFTLKSAPTPSELTKRQKKVEAHQNAFIRGVSFANNKLRTRNIATYAVVYKWTQTRNGLKHTVNAVLTVTDRPKKGGHSGGGGNPVVPPPPVPTPSL